MSGQVRGRQGSCGAGYAIYEKQAVFVARLFEFGDLGGELFCSCNLVCLEVTCAPFSIGAVVASDLKLEATTNCGWVLVFHVGFEGSEYFGASSSASDLKGDVVEVVFKKRF